jgi:alkanesulfonate monooxygenase SsuD/methylene tetrahydromethanopterin reductase-like flavin-dependent oxidoreductase (luciferase family)
MVPVVRALWQGDYAHDGDIWKFPTSTSVPKPIQTPNPPMWIAARDPDSHNFAVANGCNVMVTPLMKGDEEVLDLKNKFQTALDNNPDVPRPQLMVLRHTHVHRGRSGRLESRRQGHLTFLSHLRCLVRQQGNPGQRLPRRQARKRSLPGVRSSKLESLHKTAMIGTPEEIIPRIKYYQELGVDEFSFWCDNSLPHAEKKKSLELFIKHVVPAFR